MAKKYKFKRKPYRHQVAALRKMFQNDFGGALLMDPRTGKTQVCIDYAGIRHLRGEVNRVLIVCPVGVMGVWVNEIAACCPVPYRIMVWDKDARKEEELPAWGRDILDFVIVNVEAFQVPGRARRDKEGNILREESYTDEDGVVHKGAIKRSRSRGGRFEMKKQFQRWKPQLIILDESHRIKSPSAKKTTTLQSIGQVADYRIIATGTAITGRKRAYDVYAQWKFLNPDGWIGNYTMADFKAEFTRHVSRERYQLWVGNRNQPRLKKLMHQDAFAVTLEECRDMPKVTHSVVPVQLTGHTARVYDEMAEEMIARIQTGEITEASIKLVQGLRLIQITSGIAQTARDPRYPERKPRLARIGRDKLLVLESLVTDLFEAEKKVVIAARFRADIASIAKMVRSLGRGKNKIPVFELHGGISRTERDRNIAQFQKTKYEACFIMQPKAGSLGIDLSAAGNMIWYSLTNSFTDWDQAWRRIHLHNGPINIQYLLAQGTYDEDQYTSLLEDRDMVKSIQASPERLRRSFKKR